MDHESLAALAQYMLRRGQMAIINNREGFHHREAFKNGAGQEQQRHLVRMWFREEGSPVFDG